MGTSGGDQSSTFVNVAQNWAFVRPLRSGINLTLTQTLASVQNAFWIINTGDISVPAGFQAQARCIVIAHSLTAGDVLGARITDLVHSATYPFGEFTGAVPDTNPFKLASNWIPMPSAPLISQLQVRNQTAARGIVDNAWIEYQTVAV